MNKKFLSLFLCVAMILFAGVISVSASDASEGLSFSPSGNGTCSVVGIGTCTDAEIVIPQYSPDGDLVTSIGNSAFNFCDNLTSIYIPESVTDISEGAFGICKNLKNIYIASNNPKYYDGAGCNAIIDKDNKILIRGSNSVDLSVQQITRIGAYAYAGLDVTYINIPDCVTSIGEGAFAYCDELKSVKLSNGIKRIESATFMACSNLTNVDIPDSVTYIYQHAFYNCSSLNNINIPCNATIADMAFWGCSSLTDIVIPDVNTAIGTSTFADCTSLKSVTIPGSVKELYSGSFSNCVNLETITFTGTTEQWNNIKKQSGWDEGIGNYKLICLGDAQHEHTWDNGKVTKEPTCKDTGVKTYTCTECGETKTEVIPVTKTHTWGEWQKDTAESHKHMCTVCGKTETASHTWDDGKITTPATHVKEGIKTYTCTVCNETKTETVPKTSEHSYGSWEKHNETQHKHSCACGDVKYENHTWDNGKMTKEPTCKDTGVKTYTCAVCGETKTEIIPITGNHTWDEGKVTKEPTCKDTGVKTYTCTECGGIKTAVIPVTKTHTWGEWQKDTAESHKHTCTVCGNTESEAHTWDEGKITTPASHVKEGVKTYTCTACSETKTETVPKTAEHSYGSWEKYNETQHVHKCICGEAEYENHSFGEWNIIKEATENEYGVKRRTCTKCEAFEEESISPIPTKTSQEEQSTASPATTEQTDPGDSQIKTLTILLISLSIIIIILIIIVIYIISRKKKQTKQ